jgi:class 3 adenylate cyclase
VRKVQTVLFTDIVGSTALAAELGDRGWRALLQRHHALVRRQLRRYGGREVDTAGDGFLATFDEPTKGIRCALAIAEAVQAIGLEVRAGLHSGEVEVTDGKIGGIAVHTAARIVAQSEPGEVLVSGTLRELTAGSGARFQDRGRRRLKGVAGTWRVFAVTEMDGASPAARTDAEIAAERRRLAAEPPRRTGRTITLVATVVAVGAIAIFMLLLSADEEPTRRPGGFLVRIDPSNSDTEMRTPLPVGWLNESDVAAGEGGLWLIHHSGGSNTLLHTVPGSGSPPTRIPLPESTGTRQVIVGERSVWVLSQGPAEYTTLASQVNPATQQLVRTTEVGGTGIRWDPAGIAAGEGGVWVATVPGKIARLDPLRGTIVAQREAVPSASGLAAGEGAVWVIDSLSDSLVKLDPRNLDVISNVQLPGSADAVVAGEDAVWVLDVDSGTVVAVNPRSDALDDPVRVGDRPVDLAVGLGSVWVASAEEGAVSKINPVTREVEAIPVGGRPQSLAVDLDQGAVWVTVAGGQKP